MNATAYGKSAHDLAASADALASLAISACRIADALDGLTPWLANVTPERVVRAVELANTGTKTDAEFQALIVALVTGQPLDADA